MLAMIWAQARGRAIGKNGVLPWRVPEDMALFKRLTLGHSIIMGRKTWDSLDPRWKPLPGRINFVVSRTAGELAGRSALAATRTNICTAGEMNKVAPTDTGTAIPADTSTSIRTAGKTDKGNRTATQLTALSDTRAVSELAGRSAAEMGSKTVGETASARAVPAVAAAFSAADPAVIPAPPAAALTAPPAPSHTAHDRQSPNKQKPLDAHAYFCTSLEAAYAQARANEPDTLVWLIGGGQLFAYALEQKLADGAVVTDLDFDVPDADAFAPLLPSDWNATQTLPANGWLHSATAGVDYRFTAFTAPGASFTPPLHV
ncbi:MAG: dihydrofolate reductase [Actinomycetaceae bacterium]|nr:dihydrofolate reductase [Actinomycetaceae bacterium]MDY5854495.1 dihydrofolate reductase [Arcanobacterium sp.]